MLMFQVNIISFESLATPMRRSQTILHSYRENLPNYKATSRGWWWVGDWGWVWGEIGTKIYGVVPSGLPDPDP